VVRLRRRCAPRNGEIEIERVVSLHNAWERRARLGAKKRSEFANDFMNLEAIGSGTNATKAAVSLLDPY
jgi:hypothetical protein